MTIAAGSLINPNEITPFGNGSDGAFNETSGTTNLVQGTIYQYTTLTLGVSAIISAASASTKPIIILVQGDCTINGTINLSGKGAITSYGTYVGSIGGTPTGGLKLPPGTNFSLNQFGPILNGTSGGSGSYDGHDYSVGGGGGASSQENGSNGSSHSALYNYGGTAGGTGGATILIMVGGNLTFGVDSSIDVSGANGVATSVNQAGGGGGGSGDILILYNGTLTDNGLATDVTGGTGATGSGVGATGGNGAAGQSKIVAFDTIFWGSSVHLI